MASYLGAAGFVAASAAASAAISARRQRRARAPREFTAHRTFKSASARGWALLTQETAAVAKSVAGPRRETHHVLIGAIPGENRGPKPMDPPVAGECIRRARRLQ